MESAGAGRAAILEILALNDVAAGSWRGRTVDPSGGRMFGGTMVAQLLAAARQSVTGPLEVRNTSVQFLRPADGGMPCDYQVQNVHDGRSSAIRLVTVVQRGETVALADVAFHAPRQNWAHGVRPSEADPADLPRTGLPNPARAIPLDAFDIRYRDCFEGGYFVRRLWFRAIEPLPDAGYVHECVLALISDLYFFEPLVAQHGYRATFPSMRYATTQQTIWLHRAARTDDWLLIESRSPVAAGGRGIVTGEVRTVAGTVIATVVQEVAVWFGASRPPSPRPEECGVAQHQRSG